MEIVFDAILQNRSYDADGRLHIKRTPISKATVNPYCGREIPNSEKLGLNPERVYQMLRDPGELAKAAPSFARVQLMFDHVAVSADDPKQDSIAGTVGSDVTFEAPYLMADLCIWDAEAIAGIETDTVRELSASYRYRADMTPGVYEGKRFDGVMRDIQANHVALVKAGRAGPDVMAADSRLETEKMETNFGNAIYAILRAISPRLAKDEKLKPMVIGLKPKDFDPAALETKLLAMDAELPKEDTRKAMEAAKKVAGDEDDNAAKYANVAAKGGDKKAKDRKRAKDWTFEDWESDQKEQELEKDDPQGQDRRKARDAEEDDEDRAKRKEFEKKAEDAAKMCGDSFDDLVKKLEGKGYSKEYATKVAGKVATEKAGDKAKDSRKAKDRISKDAQTAEERAMWAQMRKDGSADDPEDDAMPASLRHAHDSQIKHAMDSLRAELREAEEARRDVRPVVGDVLAKDTAEEIYDFALDEMKVDRTGVTGVAAKRALYRLARNASKPAPRVAYDSAAVEEKIPGANRAIKIM